MNDANTTSVELFNVVLNNEEQYSIWPTSKSIPEGWRCAGRQGTKADCLEFIDAEWTDMRPLSLRRAMERTEEDTEGEAEVGAGVQGMPNTGFDELVANLSTGVHPIEAVLRPESNVKTLLDRVDRGYMNIRFTDTCGGCEVGFNIDKEFSVFKDADFDAESGAVRLVGSLVLNFIPVRCIAEIQLSTLTGTGNLEILEQMSK